MPAYWIACRAASCLPDKAESCIVPIRAICVQRLTSPRKCSLPGFERAGFFLARSLPRNRGAIRPGNPAPYIPHRLEPRTSPHRQAWKRASRTAPADQPGKDRTEQGRNRTRFNPRQGARRKRQERGKGRQRRRRGREGGRKGKHPLPLSPVPAVMPAALLAFAASLPPCRGHACPCLLPGHPRQCARLPMTAAPMAQLN